MTLAPNRFPLTLVVFSTLAVAGCLQPSAFSPDGGTGGRSVERDGSSGSSGGAGGDTTGRGGDTPGTGGAGPGSGGAGTGGASATGGRAAGGGGGQPTGGGGARQTGGAPVSTGGTQATGGAPSTGGRGGAGTGGAAGATGGAPTADGGAADAPACVPEQCNGRDDDCDGVIDDGCPAHLQVLGTRAVSSTSPVFGSVTQVRNQRFNDVCPDGMAIVGFTGNSGSALDSIGVKCGTLQVSEDRTVLPFKYRVSVGTGVDFPPSGGTLGTQNMIDSVLLCAPNQVVVAVNATTEPPGGMCPENGCAADTVNAIECPALHGLAVSCASYEITGTPGAFKLTLAGAPAMSMKVGGPSSGTPVVTTYACSASGALRQASGTFGPWVRKCSTTVVTGMQFGCTEPTVPLR